MSTAEPARRAALLLHGLPSSTRSQVLARLDESDRMRLSPLLQELEHLGIPASVAHALPAVPASPFEQADALPADVVARCLHARPTAVVAVLFHARRWRWRDAVLAQMDARRRDALDRPQTTPAVAPRLIEALCRQLCADAACQPSPRRRAWTWRWPWMQ
jgi:hypothetical protein